MGAQQLDGYGQECFLARDERGTEVLIGASLTGIVIREGPSPHFYKWNDITNLVNHKRYFGIECQNYEHSIQFILDEPESAKYVWKMCKFSNHSSTSLVLTFCTIFNVPGVPTSFGQEFSKKLPNVTDSEKTRESLFTF